MKRAHHEKASFPFTLFWGSYILYIVTTFIIVGLYEYDVVDNWLLQRSNVKPSATNTDDVKAGTTVTQPASPDMVTNLTEELLTKLQAGGYVFFIRHTHRDGPSTAQAFDRTALIPGFGLHGPEENENGVCLSDLGRAEARLLGNAIRHLNIPLGKVTTSPICRAIETAELAFGRVDTVSAGVIHDYTLANEQERETFRTLGNAVIKERPESGSNNFITSHTGVLEALGYTAIPTLDTGSSAIFEHLEDGSVTLIAVIPLLQWVQAIPATLTTQPYVPGPASLHPR